MTYSPATLTIGDKAKQQYEAPVNLAAAQPTVTSEIRTNRFKKDRNVTFKLWSEWACHSRPVTEMFRCAVPEQIQLKQPPVGLAHLLNWNRLGVLTSDVAQGSVDELAAVDCGFLHLGHTFDLSDEEVVWQWVVNRY